MAKRAISQEDKNTKRLKIMAAAMDILTEGQFPLPSIAQIVEQAGEAKGTAYLYFQSKEEIYLSAMGIEFERFCDQLLKTLEKPSPLPETLTKAMIDFGKAHPKTTYLAIITPLILESNVTDEFIVSFKSNLLDMTLRLAAVLQKRDGWSKKQAKENFLISYNLFIGMWQHCVPPRHIQMLIEKNGLTELQYDFEKKYLEIMRKIWSKS